MTQSSRVVFPASIGLLLIGSSWSLPSLSPSVRSAYRNPATRTPFRLQDGASSFRYRGSEPGLWTLPASPTPNRPVRVSVSAQEQSVRKVLWGLFAQGRRPFKMGADIQGNVTIHVKEAGFGYALSKTLEASQPPLTCEIRNGVYRIHRSVPAK